jgi:hypothetical protein
MARQVRPIDNRKNRGHQGVHTEDQKAVGRKHGGPPEPRVGEEVHEGQQPGGAPREHPFAAGHGKHVHGQEGQAAKTARAMIFLWPRHRARGRDCGARPDASARHPRRGCARLVLNRDGAQLGAPSAVAVRA